METTHMIGVGLSKFDTQFVREMLEKAGYTDLPFTAKELLQVWQEG